jgi:CheY-like chemotaxis protein
MVERTDPAAGRTLIISEGILATLGNAPTLLRRASIRLLSARTGSEVLSLAGTSDPGLLLMEYGMPDLRGDQVCRRMRAEERFRKLPIIIVGPPEPAGIELSCRRSGCSLFISAPLDDPRLLRRMAEYLGVHPRAEERIPVVLSVSYGTVTSEVLGRSLNLSVGGILVRTATPLRTGFFVSLRFYPDEGKHPILAPGRIMRVQTTEDGDYDIGIRFLTLPLESAERIQQLLRRQGPFQASRI